MMVNNKFETLEVEMQSGVATITLHRPDKLNAINLQMIDDLEKAIRKTAWRSDVRVLLLKGAGRAFSVGYDINTKRASDSPRSRMAEAQQFRSVFELLGRAPVVRIAEMHGYVIGAGMALALNCHLRYASGDTIFSIPELDVGVPFLLGGASLLTRDLGTTVAADMILNCTRLHANDSRIRSWLTGVFEDDTLSEKVKDIATRIASRPAALLLATVDTLDRARSDLLPAAPSDIFHGFFVRDDEECLAAGATYAARLKRRE